MVLMYQLSSCPMDSQSGNSANVKVPRLPAVDRLTGLRERDKTCPYNNTRKIGLKKKKKRINQCMYTIGQDQTGNELIRLCVFNALCNISKQLEQQSVTLYIKLLLMLVIFITHGRLSQIIYHTTNTKTAVIIIIRKLLKQYLVSRAFRIISL